ncbi:hypothetical protein AAG906_005596 [Vitis piasezkii]
MNQRDLITWNTLIAGYERSNPTKTLFSKRVCLLFSQKKLVELAERILEGFHVSFVLTFIITVSESSLYKVFPVRISSIPASIKGCCSLAEFYMGSYSHSLLQKNLDIWECLVRDWGTFSFRDIRSSLKPDMYSKCGNIANSHQVFGGMSRRDLVSWTTMMIGYGTHGYGEEVVELFDKMAHAIQADECVWGHFLELVKHRPNIAGTYVMLSNIYAADGKWGVSKTEKVDEKNGK